MLPNGRIRSECEGSVQDAGKDTREERAVVEVLENRYGEVHQHVDAEELLGLLLLV